MIQKPVNLPELESGFQSLIRWTALASASLCWTAGGYSSASLGEVWVFFETWVSYCLARSWLVDIQKGVSVVLNRVKFAVLALLFPLLCRYRLVSAFDVSPPYLYSDWFNPKPNPKPTNRTARKKNWQPIISWIGWTLTISTTESSGVLFRASSRMGLFF